MAFKLGDFFWKIKADTTDFDKGVKSTDTKTKTLGKSFTTLGKTIATGFVIASVAGIAKVSKELVLAASNAEETRNKFDVVFKDVSSAAEEAATNLADNFGLSRTAAQGLLSDTGDLLTGFGFTGDAALDLSTQVNELAVDLASFTNFSGGAEGASEALTKALLGERESVKALGISILDADVKAKVLENTQKGLTFETERQAKAYATLTIAQEQSQNAIGDFARSSESFANQQRIAAAAVDDLKVAIGVNLLPIASDAIGIFGDLTGKLADFIEERNRLRDIDNAATTGTGEIEAQIEGLSRQADALKEITDNRQEGFDVAERYGRELNVLAVQQQEADLAEIDAIYAKINGLKLEAQARDTKNDALAEEARLAQEAADAQQESADSLSEYLDLVESRYAETKQGQIDALKEEIELWEGYAETAVNTAPEVQAILEDLRQEYDDLVGVTEDLGNATDDLADTYSDGLSNALTKALDRQKQYFDYLQEQKDAEAELLDAREQAYNGFFGGIAALASAFGAETKEQFIAQQAFAAAEAGVNSALAFTQVLADPSLIGRPFLRVATAAGVAAAGLAQQIKILSTPVPAFATGGIVAGDNFTGDNVPVRVNSGEMILNKQQQSQLFDIANGAGGGQSINVYLGSRKIATEIVDTINRGQGGVISSRVVQ